MAEVSRSRRTMNLEEFADDFGIDRSTVYHLAKTGALPVPVIRLGRRLVVSRVAVDRLLAPGPDPGGGGA